MIVRNGGVSGRSLRPTGGIRVSSGNLPAILSGGVDLERRIGKLRRSKVASLRRRVQRYTLTSYHWYRCKHHPQGATKFLVAYKQNFEIAAAYKENVWFEKYFIRYKVQI